MTNLYPITQTPTPPQTPTPSQTPGPLLGLTQQTISPTPGGPPPLSGPPSSARSVITPLSGPPSPIQAFQSSINKNKTIKSIDDIVMSIYNGSEIISYNIFVGIGMAILLWGID